MWIGSLRTGRHPALLRLLLQGRDHGGRLRARHRRSAIYGFTCGTLAAALTAFYSWRVLLMTFHGKPRFDEHVASTSMRVRR